ncbi:NUDIX hydrolase [Corynebacterium pacaense]|uniref:NUDIX hydrolase n=1 Tax=Corynebacterium pacaense TaxID=1816684 RepID=UPI0009BBCE42|nr:NUDIX hydrolase [Corynebacterium pacaense]
MMEGVGGRKLAATVLLLRDGEINGTPDLEVYIQERVPTMPHFPRASVFPGGGVDPRDFPDFSNGDIWEGPDAHEWAQRLGTPPEVAHALVFAAVRELFEETGTLLAEHRDGGGLVGEAGAYHRYRAELESHRMSLTELLNRENLAIRTDLILPFARWASPDWDEEAHFDTFSFVAIEPVGQSPDCQTREAASSGYFPPALILEGWRAGLLRLVIPTWASLFELSRFHSTAELLDRIHEFDMSPIVDDAVNNPRYAEFYRVKRQERF